VQRTLGTLESAGNGELAEMVRVLAGSDGMFQPWVQLASGLYFDSAVPPRARELIILRLAADLNCSYMHREHVPVAQQAGLSDAEFDYAARKCPAPETVSAAEREAVEGARGLVGGGAVPAGLHDVLAAAWGPCGPVDYVFTCGFWGGLMPLMLAAFDLH
jgi:hypothetical protein